MSAIVSPCGRYRYTLERDLGMVGSGAVLFVMLNPSTADAETDDPTIRRCIGFARAWGYQRLLVGNLFALRATDPDALWRAGVDPVGRGCDVELRRLASRADLIVCAWGAQANHAPTRASEVRSLLESTGKALHHLGLTRDGRPKHPLYLRGDTKPQGWVRS